MNIPASPAPRFAGVYTFERQYHSSAVVVTPEEVLEGDQDDYNSKDQKRSRRGRLDSLVAKADKRKGDTYSPVAFFEMAGQLVGVSGNKDHRKLALTQHRVVGEWLGLHESEEGRGLLDRLCSQIKNPLDPSLEDEEYIPLGRERQGNREVFESLMAQKAEQDPAGEDKAFQKAYQLFLKNNPPQMLTIPQNADCW